MSKSTADFVREAMFLHFLFCWPWSGSRSKVSRFGETIQALGHNAASIRTNDDDDDDEVRAKGLALFFDSPPNTAAN